MTFRPSWIVYRRRTLAGAIPALVILLVIDYWRLRQPWPVYLAEAVGVCVLLAATILLYFRNTRVVAERDNLTLHNLFGRSRTLSGDQLAHAILLENFEAAGGQNLSPLRLIIVNSTGRRVMNWSGNVWTKDEMSSLVATLGIDCETLPNPMTVKRVRASYPRAIGPIEAHPWIIGGSLGLLIVVIVFVVVFASSGVPL
jgi:small-conductance mechanosensitive channel